MSSTAAEAFSALYQYLLGLLHVFTDQSFAISKVLICFSLTPPALFSPADSRAIPIGNECVYVSVYVSLFLHLFLDYLLQFGMYAIHLFRVSQRNYLNRLLQNLSINRQRKQIFSETHENLALILYNYLPLCLLYGIH